ncbi:Hypothetical_protein [Hexamita inflata]|uniref:Hypothetical_protein n=1 Tax=Hexamita inflata TaxID=28002 RepID=A0AA86QY03_9EUKA|nr:Hypothetical protein HINF_LOCUS55776 [Hexamita inflata]
MHNNETERKPKKLILTYFNIQTSKVESQLTFKLGTFLFLLQLRQFLAHFLQFSFNYRFQTAIQKYYNLHDFTLTEVDYVQTLEIKYLAYTLLTSLAYKMTHLTEPYHQYQG